MTIQPLKGFRDFLPSDAWTRQWLKEQMIKVFEKWGYEPLETPTLEPLELFAGQVGEDEQLFYKFKDWGDRDVMLRYDQTAPTCRVVAGNLNDLPFPFRRYQIQSAFRAEKPQKGRYREFTQADLDIFGITSPLADAEIIAVTLDLYKTLGFKQVVALINNRELMKNIPYEAIVAIDKLGKIGEKGVLADMVSKNIMPEKAEIYLNYVKSLKPDATVYKIFDYLKTVGIPSDWYRFEPTLARSFSYSEGAIWEITIPGFTSGSVGGGERYDGLMARISGQPISGTGIGIGFDRTLEACSQFGLVPKYTTPSKILVTIFSPELFAASLEIGSYLRQKNISVEVFPDSDARLDKQLKYAAKKMIPNVIIIGPEEVEKNVLTLKNMLTGEQSQLSRDQLLEKL